MILPLGDESYSHRVPVVNYAIVAINLAVFAAVNVFSNGATTARIIDGYGLTPGRLEWTQFFTCMFLHGGWMHIIGNMWFLWVFGQATENRLGHLGYAIFYIAAGLGASAFYLLLTPRTMIPCVGASGAIFGVVGAYAVLFPRNEIKMFYWIGWFWAGTFHVRAMWIIGFWFAEQLALWYFFKDLGGSGVAYAAHLGGGIVGLGVAVGVRTWLPAPPMEEEWGSGGGDWSTSLARGGSGFDSPSPRPFPTADRTSAPALASDGPAGGVSFLDGDLEPLDDVSQAFYDGDVSGALDLYQRHASCRPGVPLASVAQYQVADAYFEQAEFDEALEAYQAFLSRYSHEANAPTAKFRAAVILSRRHERTEEAGKLLVQVVMEHGDSEIADLARKELARIRAARV